MKQKKIVSIIGALVLLISAVAVITGCSQVNDVKSVGIIEFDSAAIKCTKNSSTAITSGSYIQEDDILGFKAILPPGKFVVNWYVNDVKREFLFDKPEFRVEKSDIVGGKLKISVVSIVAGTVEFDSKAIECKRNSYRFVFSGGLIQENDELDFKAILPWGQIIGNWYINDVKQESETSLTMTYKVKASDIADGKLKIGVVFIVPKIEFDSVAIKCIKTDLYPYTAVTSGSPITVGSELKFEAILPSGKLVENWYINDVKQESETSSTMTYKVKKSDIAGGKLKISVVFRDTKKGTVEFDSATIKCRIAYYTTAVTSGSQIQEEDELNFYAILPSGKVVENWYINDVKQESETYSPMSYKVKASDIVGGKLKIGVVFKVPEKGTVEFDSATIKCKIDYYTDVTSGSPIQENDILQFHAILTPGRVVVNWYINDVKQESEIYSGMIYRVKASDIVGGKLKIGVVLKDLKKGTIEFDSAVIKCETNSLHPTDVTSGSPIQENDALKFEAILPLGKVLVKAWYINDVEHKGFMPTKYYTVKASDIVGGKLKIGVVFK